MRERLFAEDILAGLGRRDRRDGVPMVGQTERDGVDVVPRQKLAIIPVRGAILVAKTSIHTIDSVSQMILVDVTDGKDLTIFLTQKGSEVAAPLPAHADAPHGDPITRRDAAGPSQSRRWNDVR